MWAGVLVLALVALTAHFVWQGRHDSIERGRERAQIAALTVAAHFQWFTEAGRQALRRVDEAILLRPEILNSGLLDDVDDVVASLPAGVHIRLFDARGRQILSSRPEDGAIDVSEREYFQILQDGQEAEVSSLLVDRLTKQQGFVIARRISRGGEFQGVAAVLVPGSLMTQFWATLNLGAGSATSIFRDDGKLVARYPPSDGPIDLSNHVLFREHLPKASSGSYVSPVSPADGVARIVGYARVADAPLVAVAAIATEAVLDAFHTRLKRLAIGALPLIAALILLAWRVHTLHHRDLHRRLELEGALAENQLLLREIHHRVKNNLQSISSLIQLQAMDPSSKKDLRARIGAMATVHEHIYQGDKLGEINAGDYLREVAEGVRASFGGDIELNLSLEPLNMHPDQALPLGLIVTELVSNSIKHGFANRTGGAIEISLAAQDPHTGLLQVADDGNGFRIDTESKGLGLRLLRGFATQLHGNYTIDGNDGLNFSMTFPLAGAAVTGPFQRL
jgi:two-component sensor histidine kinase